MKPAGFRHCCVASDCAGTSGPDDWLQVDHYAGKVLYAATALMEKNKDFTVAEHSNLMASSTFDFIRCSQSTAV